MVGENREEYLEAVYSLKEDGKEATTNELAAVLGVKAASVTEMLKKLHAEGYITHRPYHGVDLTEKGLDIASKVKRKHRLLERFLYDILKIRKSRIHEEACRMEHSLSDEAADALDKLMDYPKDCPDDHKPIPKEGEILISGSPLDGAQEGGLFKVIGIDGGSELRNRLRSMGVMEGKRLRLVAVEPFGGPLVVKVGNTRVTIGRSMAAKVRVAP